MAMLQKTTLETLSQLPVHIFIGTAFAFFILTLGIFYYNKKKEFLWYGLYLFFVVVYFSFKSGLLYELLYGKITLLNSILHDSSQVAINLCYLLFAMSFLNTKIDYPRFHKFLRLINWFLLGFIIVHTLSWIITKDKDLQIQLLNVQRLVMSLFVMFNIYYLLRYGKNNLVHFIVIGSLLFASGAIITWLSDDFIYMVIGVGLENFVFSFGLGYKIKKLNTEKITAEIDAVTYQINSLRAQMNPHFIFNSLNSIQGFILKDKKKESIKYLTSFSSLLRKILDTSETNTVTLKQELQLLKLYLELESLRFNENFDYYIEIDPGLDIHNIEIPILLIQPYIENSIIHGLAPKQSGTKKITLTFMDETEFVTCTITDTGIGRAAAEQLKKKKEIYKKSKGMSLTRKRLELINKNQNEDKATVHIEDLRDAEGNALGTSVTIKIYKYFH
ncbi:sensor histidine kinase [Marinirhabdus gelatinilytica]|uniref:7TM protein involved in diverse intracellular signaling n=1 Tax=Marinirhabdus gelatinilytica TaxID=1703343 RepID=A0A370QG51_9FLAO|nr:histidine kinase [Marinirhabdus gelatinilytica]RDK87347.1 7TM protein involved in diverse intracellular signaling [Marinirhabdus gelatinilytica]